MFIVLTFTLTVLTWIHDQLNFSHRSKLSFIGQFIIKNTTFRGNDCGFQHWKEWGNSLLEIYILGQRHGSH